MDAADPGPTVSGRVASELRLEQWGQRGHDGVRGLAGLKQHPSADPDHPLGTG